MGRPESRRLPSSWVNVRRSLLVILSKIDNSFGPDIFILSGIRPFSLSVDLRLASSENDALSLTFLPEESYHRHKTGSMIGRKTTAGQGEKQPHYCGNFVTSDAAQPATWCKIIRCR
jgi:hypothetical protein